MLKWLLLILLIPSLCWGAAFTNGGFETFSDWDIAPGQSTWGQTEDQKVSGTYSAQVSIIGDGTDGYISQTSDFTVGNIYRVKCYVRGLDLVDGRFYIEFGTASAYADRSNGAWVLLETTSLVASVESNSIVIGVGYTTGGGNNGKTFYVDDCVIVGPSSNSGGSTSGGGTF